MESPSFTFADIAVSWLRFAPRIGRMTRSPSGSVLEEPIVGHFVESIALSARTRTIDEVQHLVASFLQQHATLSAWWSASLDNNRIRIVYDNAQPRIDAESVAPWRLLTTKLDPDSLVALSFARRHQRQCTFKDLARWNTVVCGQSPDVRRLFLDPRIRLYDTHVHLEGCEPVPLLWLRVLTGNLAPKDFEQYRQADILKVRGEAPEWQKEYEDEKRKIGEAIDALQFIQKVRPDLLIGDEFPAVSQGFTDVNVADLWPERRFLTAVWADIIRVADDAEDESANSLVRAFDRYTQGKSAFISRLVQSPDGNPGLAAFRRFFRRGKILPKNATRASKNPARRRENASRRLMWDRWSRMGRYATETRGLAGIEFRMAPFDRVSDYVRFFRDYGERTAPSTIASQRFLTNPDLDVSFIIHFIRQEPSGPFLLPYRGAGRALGHGLHLRTQQIDEGEVRQTIDRQSAVLQRFRIEYPELARRIVGIDVANVERRNPVCVFSAYLRLLRLHTREEQPLGRRAWFRRWHDLTATGLDIVPPGMAPLGLTYHAGEDFFHPLEGVKNIWEYMNFCSVRSGDRIGHALALGIDIGRFNIERGRAGVIPQGEALDLLVWVRHRLAVIPSVPQVGMRKVEDEIDQLSKSIYGRVVPRVALYSVLRARHGLKKDVESLSDQERRLLDLELDGAFEARRNEYRSLPTCLLRTDLIDSLTLLQREIVDEVIDRELFIEVNPSSNINLLGMHSVVDHPILKLAIVRPELKITINTDDPGTFATSLEMEFALARDALRHNKVLDPASLLERFAVWSEQAAFSTPPHQLDSRVGD